jgi:nucleoside-diphosphate-sugar epimerase
VVDTSGQEPWVVDLAASTLAPVVDRYVFVSTVNAYQGWPAEPLDDDSPLRSSRPDLRAADVEELRRTDRYGTLKAGCELAVTRHVGDRLLVLRPGVILGRYEYVGRLPWLLARMRRGGQVLAGGPPTRPIQPVDVRDLATFALDQVQAGATGSMNVTAPLGHATYGELLDACLETTGAEAELVWVDPDWLAAQDVDQWREIPLWRATGGAWSVRSERAWSSGLSCRPVVDTVTDTWQWLAHEQPVAHPRAAMIGLDPGKEAALLAAWQTARSAGPDR